MPEFMKPYAPQAAALLRITAGFMLLCHGSQKLLGFPGTPHEGLPAFITYGGGSIELVGGALVMIGLFGGWAAFLCSGEMAAAYWMAHGTKGLLPISNGGELAALYCFAFLVISAHGSGIWSLDARRSGSAPTATGVDT